jgi:hypothetical protein
MTAESAHLHTGIRSGAIACYCPQDLRSMAEHKPGCRWAWAIQEIYRIERRADAEAGLDKGAT